jgi:hypothetical protein
MFEPLRKASWILWTLTLVLPSEGSGATPAPVATDLADTIYIAIAPTDTTVTPGGTFDLHLRVTQPGLGFNAYDAVIEYDPAALTFVPMTALFQEGSLMRGACGNTFHRFDAAGDSLAIRHSLLCLGVSLTGPGNLHNLRFEASSTPQITHVRVRSVQFYDAGFFVGPVQIVDARTQIGQLSDAEQLPLPFGGLRLRVAPNPFNPTTTIRVETGTAGKLDLVVRDVRGRLVRTLAHGSSPARGATWTWDGRDDGGRPVASGTYIVDATCPTAQAARRVVLVK